MKKVLLLLIIFPLLFSARASDTLTIRQVFNFDVGDTFDYESTWQVAFPTQFGADITTANQNCYRQIVKEKFYSIDSGTLIYCLYNLPDTSRYDTIGFNLLDSLIIAYDTILPPSDSLIRYSINYSGSGNMVFDYSYMKTRQYYYTKNYYMGMGKTQDIRSDLSYPNGGGSSYTTTLVYASKSSSHWHTPCSVLLAANDIEHPQSIHLYPTPTSDLLHLSYSEASQHSTHLIITDLLGREVYTVSVTQSETTHDISRLPSGIYTWRLTSDDMIIKTGKVIKE